jgi:hypothetical protein
MQEIFSNMRLYLDNCCFNRPFDEQEQLKIKLETQAKISIQSDILRGKHELIWSYILEYENQQNPYCHRRSAIYAWKNAAAILCIENEEILTFAQKLCGMQIRVKDALHIACAVYAHADYFITTDRKLLNTKIDDVRILNPLTFINEEI